jgi:malonate decarboxylase beta subunit
MRAVLVARAAGIPVIALIGGTYGCFGGMGIVSRCCDTVILSEEGRLGLSGPEVIETVKGVEEFDSRDRALVWRTVGGKHRYLLGEAQLLVDDDMDAFRNAAIAALDARESLTLEALEGEHAMLARRLEELGDSSDALDIWRKLGIPDPERLPLLEAEAFLDAVGQRRAL